MGGCQQPGSKSFRAGLEPAWLGPPDRKNPSRNTPVPAESRLHKTADYGPQVQDEYLYKVVDALDEVANRKNRTINASNWLLQRRPSPTSSSARERRNSGKISGPLAGILPPSKSLNWTKRAPLRRFIPTGVSASSRNATRFRCKQHSQKAKCPRRVLPRGVLFFRWLQLARNPQPPHLANLPKCHSPSPRLAASGQRSAANGLLLPYMPSRTRFARDHFRRGCGCRRTWA